MKSKLSPIAKILAIIYILFISIFALDEPILSLGFLIHMVPSIILIGVLILAWFKPKIGATIFVILGIAFTIFFKTYEDIIGFLILSLPLIIIGILFWFSKGKK